MTGWHLDDAVLRRYVTGTDSMAEGATVERHLLSCETCRTRVGACADVIDLDAVWERTLDSLEVPKASLLERLLCLAGLPPHEARLVAVAGAFRAVWAVAAVAVLSFAAVAATISPAYGSGLFMSIAPLVPCLAVAVSYDPWLDPAFEPEVVTSFPALRLVLLRTITVLAFALPAVLLLGLVVPGQPTVVWLLPAVGFVAVVLAASTWVNPLGAAVVLSVGWLTVVWVQIRAESLGQLLDADAQLGYLVMGTAGIIILLLRRPQLSELRTWR
jgi:hypothetical protein